MLHTARYRRFCREVLGRRLDHRPSEGGAQERARLMLAYQRTLAAYTRRFGAEAPGDIWPDLTQRFGADLAVRRVNVAASWIVPKPRIWRRLRAASEKPRRVLLAASAWLALGCGDLGLDRSSSGPQFLRGLFWLWLITLGAAVLLRRWTRGSVTAPIPALEAYELAQLAGGPELAVDSAVTSLLARGALQFDGEHRALGVGGPLPHVPSRWSSPSTRKCAAPARSAWGRCIGSRLS